MNQKDMTALVSAFSRAYHSEANQTKIFDDPLAKALFLPEEYAAIATAGARTFECPDAHVRRKARP